MNLVGKERRYKKKDGTQANLAKSFKTNFTNGSGYAFRGAEGWAQNNYVVFTRGMATDQPNFYANDQGKDLVNTLLSPNADPHSSFSRFFAYMQAIQEKEAAKERAYLSAKLVELQNSGRDQKWITKITQAINNEDYNSAFTMLYSTDEELSSLSEERKSKLFRDFQHSNKLWKSQLEYGLTNSLKQYFTNNGSQISMDIINHPNVTVESVVADYLDKGLGLSASSSKEQLRSQLEEILLSVLQDNGFALTDAKQAIRAADNNFNSIFNRAEKASRKDNVKALQRKGTPITLDTIFMDIQRGIESSMNKYKLRGKGGEFAATAASSRTGDIALTSGDFIKDIVNQFNTNEYIARGVQIKGDSVSFMLVNATDEVKAAANDIIDGFSQNERVYYEEVLKALEGLLKTHPEVQIFQTVQNIKSYKTMNNKFGGLQIEGEGSFEDRANNLKANTDKLITIGGGRGLSFFDKLIFLLNNTVENALADGYEQTIGDYIAACIVAWMFDDYTEILALQESNKSIQTLHLFNSGGMYMSASQLIAITLQNLLDGFNQTPIEKLVNVKITPPGSFDIYNQYYETLRNETYPYPRGASYDKAQAQLKNRWDDMRNKIMQEGRMGIKINQNALEKYISQIASYL